MTEEQARKIAGFLGYSSNENPNTDGFAAWVLKRRDGAIVLGSWHDEAALYEEWFSVTNIWKRFGECIEALKERGHGTKHIDHIDSEGGTKFWIWHRQLNLDVEVVADTLPAALFAALERLIDSETKTNE